MPVLPQGVWNKVDGKVKHVFFEEPNISKDKRDALMKRLQRARNYAASTPPDEHPSENVRENLYGWYPPVGGSRFMSMNQAGLDKRVFQPNDWRGQLKLPDDRNREPVSTQVNANGSAPVVPPYPTDPMAYRFSTENSNNVPIPRASPDFQRWEMEEGGRIPHWNDTVTFTCTPQVGSIVDNTGANAAMVDAKQKRPVTLPSSQLEKGRQTLSFQAQQPSIRANAKVPATKLSPNNNVPKSEVISLREIEKLQKKFNDQYRWRFQLQGDPFSVKAKARPIRHSHATSTSVDTPKGGNGAVHYSDSSTFFYNTIPVVPLSFSIGPALLSEKVIREREAKQKNAPKSTPDDRYFIPAFIY